MGDDGANAMDDDACDAGPSQACVDARQTELDAIEADSDATVGALNAAEMALADAQTALSDANTAAEEMTVSDLIDDAVTATADITDESTPAAVAVGRAAIDAAQESLDGLVDGMENLSADATAALQGRINDLEAGFSPIAMTVDTIAKTAAAATKRTAIGVEAGQTIRCRSRWHCAAAARRSRRSLLRNDHQTRLAPARTIEIVDPANAGDDDPKFIKQDADLGVGRTMHVRIHSR